MTNPRENFGLPRYGEPIRTRSHLAAEAQQRRFEETKAEEATSCEPPFSELVEAKAICVRIEQAVAKTLEKETYLGSDPEEERGFRLRRSKQQDGRLRTNAKSLARQITIYLCVHLRQMDAHVICKELPCTLPALKRALDDVHTSRAKQDEELRWFIEETCAELGVPEPPLAVVVVGRKSRKDRPLEKTNTASRKCELESASTYPEVVMVLKAAVCEAAGVSIEDYDGPGKSWKITCARWVVVWFMSKLSGLSTEELSTHCNLHRTNVKRAIVWISHELRTQNPSIKKITRGTFRQLGLEILPV